MRRDWKGTGQPIRDIRVADSPADERGGEVAALKAKAIEAFRILNSFVGDLVAGTRSLELFESPGFSSRLDQNVQRVLRRMCLSHLVITLSKWAELYDRYKGVKPILS